MRIFSQNKAHSQVIFETESLFENEIAQNSKLFFGQNSIYINAKRKIEAKALGASIPDGFLLDFSDSKNPEFYMVEVELVTHSFYKHIFPQITKFISFYKKPSGRYDLAEKIFSLISADESLKAEIKKYIGDVEIYKFLKDLLQNSQNILLVLDGEKEELPEIMEVYSDTWQKIVKLMYIKKFSSGLDSYFMAYPDFEDIDFLEISSVPDDEQEGVVHEEDTEDDAYDEEYHLSGSFEIVKKCFAELKLALATSVNGASFRYRKYYVAARKTKNFAFFHFRRKKIELVVTCLPDFAERFVKNYKIRNHSQSVQRYWGGKSCSIVVDSDAYLGQVENLLRQIAV